MLRREAMGPRWATLWWMLGAVTNTLELEALDPRLPLAGIALLTILALWFVTAWRLKWKT